MQIIRKNISSTKIKLAIIAGEEDLASIKRKTLEYFAKKNNFQGFRSGKAPLSVVEKHVDQNALQAHFIDEAINGLYQQAISVKSIRVVDNPRVNLTKFVPFSTLEFEAEVEILGKVTLYDYKKLKKKPEKAVVSTKDVSDVITNLRTRSAEKKEVSRAAKKGDELIIDFVGKNQEGMPIKGADGKDYPLILGSNTFIPGFEDNLIGLETGSKKSFTLTFPKDYGVKALANKKVLFTVTVSKVQEVIEPKLDDKFAAQVGPFKTMHELKQDIKKQLQIEKQSQADRKFESELVQQIVDKSSVELPEILVGEQLERLKNEVRQNLAYRGQTWKEMLEAEGISEDDYISKHLKPEAERRVKTGLVLAEISILEKLEVSPEELEVRIQVLKTQYSDPMMQAELNKPDARKDIASRLLTEKTVQRLVEQASK